MKYKIIVLSLLLLTQLSASYGQANYKTGIITLQDGTELKGSINYKEWTSNPESFQFIESTGQKITTYYANEVRSVHIADLETYESRVIEKSMGMVEKPEGLSIGPDRKVVPDTVFLKLICTGKLLTLYSYEDNLKRRFYVEDNNQQVKELLYYQYLDTVRQTNIIKENTYRNQLLIGVYKKTSIPASTLIRKLEKVDYYQKDLEYIVNYINNDGRPIASTKNDINVHLYAGLSLLNMNARYTGQHRFAENNLSSNSLYPKLSFGIDMFNNYNIGQLLIRLDFSLSFRKHKFSLTEHPTTIQTDITTQEFSQLMFHINPQVIYNVYNKENVKVNIGTGIGAEINYFPKNEYTLSTTIINSYEYNKGFELNRFRLFFPVRAGVFLGKRFDIYAQYNHYLIELTSYTFYNIDGTSLQAGVNFLF